MANLVGSKLCFGLILLDITAIRPISQVNNKRHRTSNFIEDVGLTEVASLEHILGMFNLLRSTSSSTTGLIV